MKLYRFYQSHSDEALSSSIDLDVSDKYPLYAFTNDKKLRDEFKEVRDMTKFIEFKDDVELSDYRDFANSHSRAELRSEKLKSFNGYGVEQFILSVPVVCTWNEMDYLSDAMDLLLTDISYIDNPFIFKEKYMKALKDLEYIKLWSIFKGSSDLLENMDDDYSAPAIGIDELQVFLSIFGELFKT